MKKQLSKSEIKELNQKLNELYSLEDYFDKKERIDIIEKDEFEMIVKDNTAIFFVYEGKHVPTLKLLQTDNFMKKITIDMGAVKFVTSGADVMRPGITDIEPGIDKDGFVVIIDEKNKKPLAIGITMFSAEEMKSMDKGKVIKIIHFVGDKLWNIVV